MMTLVSIQQPLLSEGVALATSTCVVADDSVSAVKSLLRGLKDQQLLLAANYG